MRWLIVEDALRDRKGHWFEYLNTFWRDLHELGDDVVVLTDKKAEPFIIKHFNAQPVLPESIWHRMGDNASSLRRYLRVPAHAFLTCQVMRAWLKHNTTPEIIFVPTVLVHHLLGWAWLIKGSLRHSSKTVLLFFPNLPIYMESNGRPSWVDSPTTRLMSRLFQWLAPEIASGRVVLGVETHPMRHALTNLIGLPVVYFPHPVTKKTPSLVKRSLQGNIVMACYGAARFEKGSNLLQNAILLYLKKYPDTNTHFVLQWIEDFQDTQGNLVKLIPALRENDRVEIIDRYFVDGEYANRLAQTNVMILPYRRSSYSLRVSRVVIEAMTNSIPVIAASGTTLADQARDYSTVICYEDGDVESLVKAMREMEDAYERLSLEAENSVVKAQEHFSVYDFRERLKACHQGGG